MSLGGIPRSGKSKALSHLLDHYVDPNVFPSMKKKTERLETIAHYELVATGFHSSRNLTITEVTKESSCAFGILSVFKNDLLLKNQVPLFNFNPKQSSNVFEDCELDNHLIDIFRFLYSEDKQSIKGTEKEQQYARSLKLLPEGIALINIWDIAINKTVLHFMTSLSGLLYNSHMLLFLDIDRDLENLDKPPETYENRSAVSFGKDRSVLMKWRPRLHYLLRWSRMSESKHGRTGACTIFAKHEGTYNENLKQKVKMLEGKVKQAAKHIGVSSLIEPKIETIKSNGLGISDDSSRRLYHKIQQLIYDTPYEDVPLSWVFLCSLFYKSSKIFIVKSELRKKAIDVSSKVQTSSVSEMILSWNERLVQKEKGALIEPRRILARKLVEVGAKFSSFLENGDKLEAESNFQRLARDLDVHGMISVRN